jgi:transcriptional regulator with XRE-family HTH domain
MDWKSLIADLKAAGYSQPQIADAVGRDMGRPCGQATIAELATGKTSQPRYELGRALERLHRKTKRKSARV